jgi:hypothetical protein
MKRVWQYPARIVSTQKESKREKVLNLASVEVLENRLLLSGNVLASVSHGSLHIRGDAAGDAIVVDQVGLNADQVRIAPANGTVVNNQASPIILSGITRGVFIQMGKGDDSLTLAGPQPAGQCLSEGLFRKRYDRAWQHSGRQKPESWGRLRRRR